MDLLQVSKLCGPAPRRRSIANATAALSICGQVSLSLPPPPGTLFLSLCLSVHTGRGTAQDNGVCSQLAHSSLCVRMCVRACVCRTGRRQSQSSHDGNSTLRPRNACRLGQGYAQGSCGLSLSRSLARSLARARALSLPRLILKALGVSVY
jgi:hypothetical protein